MIQSAGEVTATKTAIEEEVDIEIIPHYVQLKVRVLKLYFGKLHL